MTYRPQYTGPIEGWTVNYCKKHLWRVSASMEWSDLMQESYIVFLRCQSRYPEPESPQHFMSLYQRAWINTITDLAYDDSKLRTMITMSNMTSDDVTFEAAGELNNDGHLATLLRQAPAEVLLVLNLFLSAPTEIVELALSGWQGRDKRCKTKGSAKICRMLGLPADLDVLTMVEEYLTA